jgi:hypothetical protein
VAGVEVEAAGLELAAPVPVELRFGERLAPVGQVALLDGGQAAQEPEVAAAGVGGDAGLAAVGAAASGGEAEGLGEVVGELLGEFEVGVAAGPAVGGLEGGE